MLGDSTSGDGLTFVIEKVERGFEEGSASKFYDLVLETDSAVLATEQWFDGSEDRFQAAVIVLPKGIKLVLWYGKVLLNVDQRFK